MKGRPALLVLVGLAVAVTGAVGLAGAVSTPDPTPVTAVAPARPEPRAVAEPAAPVAVHIPRLGVHSPLVDLGVDPVGVLVPPATASVAGWHAGGTVPGEVGPAVVAGHVDSRSGPGVFIDVATLVPGDTVEVERADGETVGFTVRAVETVDKQEFPTAAVYGPTAAPELRLITCGGYFDAPGGHYTANVIVQAVRTDVGSGWTFPA